MPKSFLVHNPGNIAAGIKNHSPPLDCGYAQARRGTIIPQTEVNAFTPKNQTAELRPEGLRVSIDTSWSRMFVCRLSFVRGRGRRARL